MHDPVDGPPDPEVLRHVVAAEQEPWMAHQVVEVALRPGQQRVEAHDVMALRHQALAQVRPQEPGTAGDQEPHRPTPRAGRPVGR
jgi:hypothetical protein